MGQQDAMDFEEEEKEEMYLHIKKRWQMRGTTNPKVLTFYGITRHQQLQDEAQKPLSPELVHQI